MFPDPVSVILHDAWIPGRERLPPCPVQSMSKHRVLSRGARLQNKQDRDVATAWETDKEKSMNRFLYFAYGSNLLTRRLTDRCSSARYHATACIDNLAVEFCKESREDGYGKAKPPCAASEPPRRGPGRRPCPCVHESQVMLGLGVALLGRCPPPVHGQDVVLDHAFPERMHHAQCVLGFRVFLCRRLSKPVHRGSGFRGSTSPQTCKPQTKLCSGMSCISGIP